MTSDSARGHAVTRIHTLGPDGTNCQAAATFYASRHHPDAAVVLHETLEQGIDEVLADRTSVLMGCVVYPNLHNLVFPYLDKLYIADIFMFDTFNMVLAKPPHVTRVQTVATHPAPQALVSDRYEKSLVNSNAEAARLCKAGQFDACITTLVAAQKYDLVVVEDHGPVPMGFTIHAHKE